MSELKLSVYKRGGDDGFVFGIYLVVMFFATAYSMAVPFAGLLSTLMMLAVPVVMYRFLRRTYVAFGGKLTFSELWLQGIVTFFCGGLISGLVAVVFMRWIQPDFIVSQANAAIKIWEESGLPQGQEMADVLRKAIEQKMIPSSIQLVIEMLWLQVFSGSILSIVLSLIIRSIKMKSK